MQSIYYKDGDNMFEEDKPRYATHQIVSNVSVEIQGILWTMMDIRRNNQETLDYLQVLFLKVGNMQMITNKQEQPPMEREVHLKLKES
jgi:hypothetical protein